MLTRAIENLGALCDASRRHALDPYTFEWPDTLDENAWYFSPELISAYGSDTWNSISEAQQKRLSFFEAINFFSLNVHDEKLLIAGMAERLYRGELSRVTPYLHHFLEEESHHLTYFATFCQRYHRLYPERTVHIARSYEEGEDDFLFFLKVLIFEETVDRYNVVMMNDSRLADVARRINKAHHHDEARHLAFGRKLVVDLFEAYSPGWSAETLSNLRGYTADYFRATWAKFYNPMAYRDAELPGDAVDLRDELLGGARWLEHRKSVSRRCVGHLSSNGILLSEPNAF
jgi:hypothetical protein